MWCTPEEHRKLVIKHGGLQVRHGNEKDLGEKAMRVAGSCQSRQQGDVARRWLKLLKKNADRLGIGSTDFGRLGMRIIDAEARLSHQEIFQLYADLGALEAGLNAEPFVPEGAGGDA